MLHVYLVTVLCILSAKAQYFDYYWRDYDGQIPVDALIGGQDKNATNFYIGQVYLHSIGVSVGQLFPGDKTITVPGYGVNKRNYLIKILCTGHPEKFYWFKTDADNYHLDTIGRHCVVGGYDHTGRNKGVLHIGRVMHNGELKIGAIASYDASAAYIYFPDGDEEKRAKVYEVLIYQNSTDTPIDVATNVLST